MTTVSEMVDFRSGVRITARHCFMLDVISVHVRPSLCLSVQPSLPPTPATMSFPSSTLSPGTNGRASNKTKKFKTEATAAKASEEDVAEAQFGDELWDELLDGGYICGEERWLIGQDRSKRITIVRF